MNHNFAIKFKKWDILIIVISVVISSCLLVGILLSQKNSSNKRIVEISHNGAILTQYTTDLNTLTEAKTIVLTKAEFPSLLGDFEIQLDKQKGIRAAEVTCPNHTCTKQGWINMPNLPIICIPNDVKIVILSSSDEEPDFVIEEGGKTYESNLIF